MSTKVWLLAIAATVATVPLQAMAQDADFTADVRCVAVGLRAGELQDSRQKSTGLLMALYYIGRLDGRNPKLDLQTLVSGQLAKMTQADFDSEAVRCGNGLTSKGEQITKMGQSLHFGSK